MGSLSFHAAEQLLAVLVDDDEGDSFEIHAATRGGAALSPSVLEAVKWDGDPPGAS